MPIQNARERFGKRTQVAGPALLDRLLNASDEVQPVGFAIVRAAVDWQRANLQRPVSGENLEQLYPSYLSEDRPAYLSSDAFRGGLKWATERLYGSAALLIEERDGYRAFDYRRRRAVEGR